MGYNYKAIKKIYIYILVNHEPTNFKGTSARATDISKINILILDFYYMIKFYNTQKICI